MREGLATLPWFQTLAERFPEPTALLSDCEKCMASTNRSVRQSMACGYEARPTKVDGRTYLPTMPAGVHSDFPWPVGWPPRDPDHPLYDARAEERRITTCVGFSSKLPAVVEIARAWKSREKGALAVFLDGSATEAMLLGIDVFDAAVAERDRWMMTPEGRDYMSKDGG